MKIHSSLACNNDFLIVVEVSVTLAKKSFFFPNYPGLDNHQLRLSSLLVLFLLNITKSIHWGLSSTHSRQGTY